MTKRLFAIWAAVLIAGAGSAAAAGKDRDVKITGDVGAGWTSFRYNEPGVMKEDGSMFGVHASCVADIPRLRSMVRLTGSYETGTLVYDGALFMADGSKIPVSFDTPNDVLNFRVVAGRKFDLKDLNTTVVPVAGLGYRYLYNDLMSESIYGYKREQTYWYLPLGIETETADIGGWRWGVRADYDILLSGYNDSGGESFRQDDGSGFHLSAFVSHAVSPNGRMVLTVEPYFRYWDIKESSMSRGGFVEPRNDCTEYGIKAVVEF